MQTKSRQILTEQILLHIQNEFRVYILKMNIGTMVRSCFKDAKSHNPFLPAWTEEKRGESERQINRKGLKGGCGV